MPSPFFRIEMLPARHGDCLWVEYGQGGETKRLLIDGGPVSTFGFIQKRLQQVPQGEKSFELIVLTHVDADHVEGLVRLFAETPLPFVVNTVWFNGWRQMNEAHKLLGALQGEFLSALLLQRAPRAWNPDSTPIAVLANGKLPKKSLPGGMKLTLLSPTPLKLKQMAKAWRTAIVKKGMNPGDLEAAWNKLSETKKFLPNKGLLGVAPDLDELLKKQFVQDQAKPNGSSIAFLAEYKKKSALFLADAHPNVVSASIRRLCKERGISRLKVDAVKVSHHGSKGNTSDTLLKLIDCPRWLFSTNGDQFKHPDKPCIARILKIAKPKELYFNYRSAHTKPWLTVGAQKKHNYQAIARPDSSLSLKIEL